MTYLSKGTKQVFCAVVLGLLAGVASPFIDAALSCRAPESEACVWGKAYLPLSLGISVPVIGTIVAVIAYAVMAWRGDKARKNDDV